MPRRTHPRDYELPPTLMAAWRHPRTRVIHFRSECNAMKYGRNQMTLILIRTPEEEGDRAPGETCRFCFGF